MNSRNSLLIYLILFVAASSACDQPSISAAKPLAELPATMSASEILLQNAENEVAKSPDEPRPLTNLAGIYVRRARETGDFSLNSKAESAVKRALELAPDDVTALKMEASLHLTYHRFSEGLEAGKNLKQKFPADSFVYGVLTDANVELGNYADAVESAQKMVDLKPNTSSYARVAHLRALNGDDAGAIQMMKQAARAADPMDKEAQSWCLVQLGDVLLRTGKFAEAESVYDEALANFPDYYLAVAGKGKVRAALGDLAGAEKYLSDLQNRIPNAEVSSLLSEIYTIMNDPEKAERESGLLEIAEARLGVSGDQRTLALFWADRDMRLPEALAIAEREHAVRKDIYTADIYAWCLLKSGRTAEAKIAIDEALRLKTNDARIFYHAGMIAKAENDSRKARGFLERALKLNPAFDPAQSVIARTTLTSL